MPFTIACPTCHNLLTVHETPAGYVVGCPTCHNPLTVPGVALPHRAPITAPVVVEDSKAERNHLQATFKLHACQAHLETYFQRLPHAAREGLEFIEAALEVNPDSSSYLNTKALLLSDGLGEHQKALRLLKRALSLEPDSIQIKQNIRHVENTMKGCLGMVLLVILGGSLGLSTAVSVLLVN